MILKSNPYFNPRKVGTKIGIKRVFFFIFKDKPISKTYVFVGIKKGYGISMAFLSTLLSGISLKCSRIFLFCPLGVDCFAATQPFDYVEV